MKPIKKTEMAEIYGVSRWTIDRILKAHNVPKYPSTDYARLAVDAWLSKHPDRTKAWLKRKQKEGFDLHHIDEDRSNNNPDNIILIEHRDHMSLHNSKLDRMTKGTTAKYSVLD